MSRQRVSVRQAYSIYSEQLVKATLGVAVDVFQTVAQRDEPVGTPVLSGFHAGSWRLTVNRISKSVASRAKKKEGKRLKRRTIPAPPTPEINASTLKVNDTIYLTNHADVIVGLNEGKISQKSPAGFIEAAVASAVARAPSIYQRAIGR